MYVHVCVCQSVFLQGGICTLCVYLYEGILRIYL